MVADDFFCRLTFLTTLALLVSRVSPPPPPHNEPHPSYIYLYQLFFCLFLLECVEVKSSSQSVFSLAPSLTLLVESAPPTMRKHQHQRQHCQHHHKCHERQRRQTPQVGWVLRLISARELSDKMCRKVPYSLNVISHDAAAELIRAVQARGVKVTQVYVDTVGDPGFYQAKLEK